MVTHLKQECIHQAGRCPFGYLYDDDVHTCLHPSHTVRHHMLEHVLQVGIVQYWRIIQIVQNTHEYQIILISILTYRIAIRSLDTQTSQKIAPFPMWLWVKMCRFNWPWAGTTGWAKPMPSPAIFYQSAYW